MGADRVRLGRGATVSAFHLAGVDPGRESGVRTRPVRGQGTVVA
jgi:hypothetical protein